MGLERLAAVLQHVHSNYEIDLFQALIRKAGELTGTADLENKSLRVIADHIRACSFLIVDGVLPSNEGRGYVLRRIIRRALRHGWMLGTREPFFHRLVGTLSSLMGEAYPELPAKAEFVERALLAEEERFAETLDAGMKIFDDVAAKSGGKAIPGADAFRLYDTYGFPLDLTQDIARERGITVDVAGFDAAMEKQRETARAAGKFGGGVTLPAELVAQLQPTQFLGYDELQAGGLIVLAMLKDGRPVDAIEAGDEAIVILDRTPFYGESGGQVGDTGGLDELGVRFRVDDTQKLAGQFHAHVGRLEAGTLRRGDHLLGSVDAARRGSIVLNHSATHLLHGALRGLLGTHVAQKGSLVAPDRLRFDFSHFQPVGGDELAEIERRVNVEVRGNHPVVIRQMGMQEAIDSGAIALFGEKYGERVRVVAMGDSVELCGGTHVGRTGEIGLFKLVSEGGVSAGVRRIEALTGQAALDHVVAEERRLREAAGLLGGTTLDVADKLRGLLDRQKRLEREVETHKAKAASGATADLAGQAVDIGGIKVLAARLEGLDAKALRDAMDRLRQQLGDAAIVLAGASDGKAALVAGVSGAANGRVRAGELVAFVAGRIGGKGGGRPDMAQGGGTDGPELRQVLAEVPGWVSGKLSPA